MDSLIATINKEVSNAVIHSVNGYIKEFASKLAAELPKQKKTELTEEWIVGLWNTVAEEFKLKKGGAKKKGDEVPEGEQCQHQYTKGDHKDQFCGEKTSEKSETGKYCVRHYKSDEKEKPAKAKSQSDKTCVHLLVRGEKAGEECGAKVSEKSKSGNYCGKHLANEVKKFDKSAFVKDLKRLSGDDEVGDVLADLAKIHGFMAIYKLETLAPTTYKKYKTEVDEYIESEEKNHKKEIDSEKKSTKKSKSEKSVKSESTKKSKSEKSKKSEPEEDEVEEVDDVTDEEVDESEEKKSEPEEEIVAKKFRSGPHKGSYYIMHGDVQYFINESADAVTGKCVKDKRVALTAADKKIVQKMGLDVE